MEMTVDPKRYGGPTTTGIYVRAKLNGKYGTYDIADLDAPSLLMWLRSRGGFNPWAENTVGRLLGHDKPIATENSNATENLHN